MELYELSQHKSIEAVYTPFSLTSSERKIIIIGRENCSYIYEPLYEPEENEEYSFKIEKICVSSPPEDKICNTFQLKHAYHTSHFLKRQQFILNPFYASELTEVSNEGQINIVAHPPEGAFTKSILAVVSSIGLCEIREKSQIKRTWNKVLLRVNDLWSSIFQQNKSSIDCDDIAEYVNESLVTTCCWADNFETVNVCKLYCSTISGTIIPLTIEGNTAKVHVKHNSGLQNINLLKSFTIKKNNSFTHYLLASNIKGMIKLFRENEQNILVETSVLWSRQDNMMCFQFEIHILDSIQNLVIATTKGSHFLVFFIDYNGILIQKKSHFVGGGQITGFSSYCTLQYFVLTLIGHVEHIVIEWTNSEIHIAFSKISHNMNKITYHFLGMCPTVNKAAWIFALCPPKSYSFRPKDVCILSTNVLNKNQALKILTDAENVSLERYGDCAEVMRVSLLKNLLDLCYLNYQPEFTQLNKSCLNQLRVRLIIAQGQYEYQRRKLRASGTSVEKEVSSIRHTLRAISVYNRLNYLINLENLTDFQKHSGMCLRRALSKYLNSQHNQKFSYIKETFISVFKYSLERTENLFGEIPEKCVYCFENINQETGLCEKQHTPKRCCISFVQVPLLIGNQYCRCCKDVALEIDLLREVLLPNEEVRCPLYNNPMQNFSTILEN